MRTSQWLTRSLSSSKILKCAVVLIIMLALFGELEMVQKARNCNDAKIDEKSSRSTSTDIGNVAVSNAIAPGELPGYTGWARPEKTLARSFSIKSVSTRATTNIAGIEAYEYVITVKCEGHNDCVAKNKNKNKNKDKDNSSRSNANNDNCASLFFLRAYGPAVVTGIVTSRFCGRGSIGVDSSAGGVDGCQYEITFVFYDPGSYTIEVVLTFSNPPPISAFPLGKELNQQEPHYEGYLLPGFPLITTVRIEEKGKTNPQNFRHATKKSTSISDSSKDKFLCKFEDLIESSPTSAMKKARWKVTGKVNEKKYSSRSMNSSLVSTIGYINNVNSLGIIMDYQYVNDCLIIEESFFHKDLYDKRAISVGQCSGPQEKIHIIYIGDSVLRVQKEMLQKYLKGIPTHQVKLTFLSLHGGYRKNQELGPTSVEQFFHDLQMQMKSVNGSNKDNEKVVILFNTGLHDIHRLCGAEFLDERPAYLNKDRLSSGTFSCVDEYRALLKDFVNVIDKFPAALKVFQSTTAAWPKYGNYGIGWEPNAQSMVLVSDFCAAFNEIAFEVLADYKDSNIHVMDGYWITYPRPDNREVGDIGKKLSHPGVEVLSAMTRKWVMLILDRACLPI